MYINNVISYLGAWDKLRTKNIDEYNEILVALTNFINGSVELEPRADGRTRGRMELWDKALFDLGWELNDRSFFAESGRRISLGNLGPTKNGIGAQHGYGNPTMFNRWLFTHGTLGVRHGALNIPIMVVPTKEYERSHEDRRFGHMGYFEYFLDQIQMLAPLSTRHPFIILGYSDQQSLISPSIVEIESDPNITSEKVVVDRCIEFPPEYHQAGLGILNYFGTFLRENYNEKDAKVKIEQSGLNVRLVVETEDGYKEVVEKALKDYELVVSGNEIPERIAQNDKILLELKNELRIAQVRVESQQDIIGVQNNRIEKLLTIVGDGLKSTANVTVEVNPVINNQLSVDINQDISHALGNISELIDLIPPSSEAYIAFNELDGSLQAIKKESDPSKVRSSPAMSKFKRILDKIASGNEQFSSAIKVLEDGAEIVSSLARNYNNIACWCGLPTIPEQLIKKSA